MQFRAVLLISILCAIPSAIWGNGGWNGVIDNTVVCFGYKIHLYSKFANMREEGMVTIRNRTGIIVNRFYTKGQAEVISCEKNSLGIGQPVAIITAAGSGFVGQSFSYWALGERAVNLLSYKTGVIYATASGRELHPFFKDLDGDGVNEIVSTEDSLRWFPDGYGDLSPLWEVFCYDGHQYHACTNKFAAFIIKQMATDRQELLRRITSVRAGDKSSIMNCIALAELLYASYLFLDEGDAGLTELKNILPASIYREFQREKSELEEQVARRSEKMKWYD